MKFFLSIVLSVLVLAGCATSTAKPHEYIASHIMCPTESDAKQALARIRAGESFESIAREVSLDPGTRGKGGRIAYWTKADSWSQNFAAEVKRLNVGEVSSTPVKTEFGWHIVRVDAVR